MRNLLSFVILAISLIALITKAASVANSRPMMGWSTYPKFGCVMDCVSQPNDCIGENLMKRTTEALISKKFHDLGYRNLLLERCWSSINRDLVTRKINVSAVQFPSGLPALINYVHEQGLQVGLLFIEKFKDPSTVVADAQSTYEFNVDFISHHSYFPTSIVKMRGELDRYSKSVPVLCCGAWLVDAFQAEIPQIDWRSLQQSCAAWCMTNRTVDSWTKIVTTIKSLASHNRLLREQSGPGHLVNLHTLNLQNSTLTESEKRTNMGMWCLMSSPLFFSDDFNTMDDFTYQLLTNEKLIAIDQDPSAPATYKGTHSGLQVWVRKLSTANNWVVAFMNEHDKNETIEPKMSQLLSDVPADKRNHFALTDVFNGVSRGSIDWHTPFKIEVRGHDTEMFSVQY